MLHDESLIESIEKFRLDEPQSAYPFSARLAKENGWPRTYAKRVCREYLRFVALMATSKTPLSPSPAVDQAWHLHLTYSRSYWERLCQDIVGRPLHHEPTKGGREESIKFDQWYRRTLDRYQEVFNEWPPSDIWPACEGSAQTVVHQWVNLNDHYVVPKNSVRRTLAIASLVFVMFASLAWAAPNEGMPFPFNLDGPIFLAFYIPLLVGSFVIGITIRMLQYLAGGDSDTTPSLSASELAILRGGPSRAISSAIYALSYRGNIEVEPTSGKGIFAAKSYNVGAKGILDSDASAMEKEIFQTLAQGEMTLLDLCKEIQPTCRTMRDSLIEKGLVHKVALGGKSGMDWLALVPVGIVVVIGLLRIIQGISNDRPVMLLVLAFIVALVGLTLLLKRWGGRTVLGRRVLAQQEDQALAIRSRMESSPHSLGASDVLLGVALFGPALMTTGVLPELGAWIDQSYRRAFGNSGAAGWTPVCSNGSSCSGNGGGGCGGHGGGCGGCGGGGD